MDDLTWEALLPPIFASAGIDAGTLHTINAGLAR